MYFCFVCVQGERGDLFVYLFVTGNIAFVSRIVWLFVINIKRGRVLLLEFRKSHPCTTYMAESSANIAAIFLYTMSMAIYITYQGWERQSH